MLCERLTKVCTLVNQGMIVADIGTDHAYLPCFLISSGKCDKVYACDVVEGPLNQALKTVELANMTEKVIIVKSNGLENLSDDVDCVCICGMGYHTVEMILNNDIEKVKKYKKVIIQINKNTNLLRKWISDRNYKIIEEIVVFDSNKFYEIISFNCEFHESYNMEQIYLGVTLPKLKSATYMKYLNQKLVKLQNISNNHISEQINKEIIMIENYLKTY